VVRRGILETTAYSSGQALEVYPMIAGQTRFLAPTANSIQKYEIPTPITSAPNLRAAVA
jgi:hypothetical protein